MPNQTDYHTLLLNALLSDMDIQSLLNLCSELVGNPIALGNARLTVLYTAGHMPPEVPMATPGMISPDFFKDQEFIKYNEAAFHSETPVLTPVQFGGYRTLIERLCHKGQVVGYMSVLLSNKPYDPSIVPLILAISSTLENYLRKDNIFFSEMLTPGEAFLLALLDHSASSTISNADTITRLGLKKQSSFYLMTFKISGFQQANSPNNILKENLIDLTGADMGIFHKEHLVLLIQKQIRPLVTQTPERDALISYMNQQGICGGISYLCRHIYDIDQCYTQSLKALAIAESNKKQPLVAYDKIVINQFIKEKIYPTKNEFQMPELAALMAYDQSHKTQYCRLLELYVENEKHISLTATAAGLSRGTIYRILERIRQITGIQLEKNEQLFSLYLGIKIVNCHW